MTDPGFKVRQSSASDASALHVDQVTIDGVLALLERVKVMFGPSGQAFDVSAASPLPTADSAAGTALASIEATLTSILGGEATQSTLASLLTELTTLTGANHSDLAAVLAKLPASPALDATITALQTSNHTDLAAILAKLTADPATQTTLAAILAKLNGTLTIAPQSSGDLAGTLTDGRKTVAAPGTAVALAVSSACKWVSVTALLTNTAQVNVGGSGVLATSGGSTGTPLVAGSTTTIPVSDPSKVFVDARVAGEGVSFTVGS